MDRRVDSSRSRFTCARTGPDVLVAPPSSELQPTEWVCAKVKEMLEDCMGMRLRLLLCKSALSAHLQRLRKLIAGNAQIMSTRWQSHATRDEIVDQTVAIQDYDDADPGQVVSTKAV